MLVPIHLIWKHCINFYYMTELEKLLDKTYELKEACIELKEISKSPTEVHLIEVLIDSHIKLIEIIAEYVKQ